VLTDGTTTASRRAGTLQATWFIASYVLGWRREEKEKKEKKKRKKGRKLGLISDASTYSGVKINDSSSSYYCHFFLFCISRLRMHAKYGYLDTIPISCIAIY